MSKNDELAEAEAYAFLNVVAPKLEQLRRRLIVANKHLKASDPEQARLNAILESQTAIREFLTSIPHLSTLVEPIDVLLDAVREEPAEAQATEAVPDELEPEPEPEPEPAAVPADPAIAPTQPVTVPEGRQYTAPADAWLQIGTALMIEKLTVAGMPPASAETHLEGVYATLGLAQADGRAISLDTIRTWRSGFVSARPGGWRAGSVLKRKGGSSGVNPVAEAKQRVAEMATTFKKMAKLGASKR